MRRTISPIVADKWVQLIHLCPKTNRTIICNAVTNIIAPFKKNRNLNIIPIGWQRMKKLLKCFFQIHFPEPHHLGYKMDLFRTLPFFIYFVSHVFFVVALLLPYVYYCPLLSFNVINLAMARLGRCWFMWVSKNIFNYYLTESFSGTYNKSFFNCNPIEHIFSICIIYFLN